MRTPTLIEWIAVLAFPMVCAFAQSQPPTPNPAPTVATPRRLRVAADSAAALVVQKVPPKYPDAAVKAGIQGKVVLRVITSYSGDVGEVTVVSGDPALSQAAADAVKQWKYKPYLVEGSPTEMETELSVNFTLKSHPQPTAPPLGAFSHNAYSNSYFDILYPLSRDWVRETNLMRGKLASEGISSGTYVLLAAVHIPQDSDPLRADSSFTVLAVTRAAASSQDCKQYLELVANTAESQKQGRRKGDMTQFSIAGHDFYRSDLEFRHGVDHRTFVCSAIKDALLEWNIVGWSKPAIETAVSTLNSITPLPPSSQPEPQAASDDTNVPKRVKVTSGVSTGLLIKKVVPVYPREARDNRIEGSVVMNALISKTGDIEDVEVVSGPLELVPSAVNAVRKWKYRPYLFMGEPVAVETQVVVNYSLHY